MAWLTICRCAIKSQPGFSVRVLVKVEERSALQLVEKRFLRSVERVSGRSCRVCSCRGHHAHQTSHRETQCHPNDRSSMKPQNPLRKIEKHASHECLCP